MTCPHCNQRPILPKKKGKTQSTCGSPDCIIKQKQLTAATNRLQRGVTGRPYPDREDWTTLLAPDPFTHLYRPFARNNHHEPRDYTPLHKPPNPTHVPSKSVAADL